MTREVARGNEEAVITARVGPGALFDFSDKASARILVFARYPAVRSPGGIMGGAGTSGQRSEGAGFATATPAAHKSSVALTASAIVFVAMTIAFLFSFGCLATALWIGATVAYFGAFMPTKQWLVLSKLVQAGLLFTSFAITMTNWEACKPVAWIPVLLSYSFIVDAAEDKWKN